MDYGHNPAALEQMSDLVRKLRPRHQRIVGVLGGPGDRRDDDLRRLGQLAAGMFDELIVREDDRLRGRAPGEAARLIEEGALTSGMPASKIATIPPEPEAVRYALDHGKPGDLVVIFADQVTPVWKSIIYYGTEQSEEPRTQD
jgi:cyanophycin synthetase